MLYASEEFGDHEEHAREAQLFMFRKREGSAAIILAKCFCTVLSPSDGAVRRNVR